MSVTYAGSIRRTPAGEHPFAAAREVLEQLAGIDRFRIRQIPEAGQAVVDALRVAVGDRPHDRELALPGVGVEVAQQAEVEQAQPPVRAQDAVVGVRVAGDDAGTQGEVEVAAEGDLGDAIAFRLVEALDLVAPQSLHILGHEHAARREVRVHAWHPDVRVVAEQSLQTALVLGLQLVVDLVGDPVADLGQHRASRRAPVRGARGSGGRVRGCAGRPRPPPPRPDAAP